jgi:hypothetical protein
MKIISHRGNVNGRLSEAENRPEYIDDAIRLGYDVEIDVWDVDGKFFLGHDEPQYPVELGWLVERKDNLWIHTKNFEALHHLIDIDVRVFYHEQERQTIINNCNLIWSHDLNNVSSKSIIPLLDLTSVQSNYQQYKNVYGICSDYVDYIK